MSDRLIRYDNEPWGRIDNSTMREKPDGSFVRYDDAIEELATERSAREAAEQHHELLRKESDDRHIRIVELRSRLTAAEDLLRRIQGWDMLGATADGPYWKREIEAALAK